MFNSVKRSAILRLCLLLVPAALFADEPAATTSGPLVAQAAVGSTTTQSTAPPQILPSNPPDQGPLASPTPPQLPSLQQLDEVFRQTPLGKTADEARLHVQWRELSNRAINDPDLVAARRQAESARTDLEKRKRMRAYYSKYFDRLYAKADTAELKNYIETRKFEHLALLAQNRVRPGDAALPTPRPSLTPVPPVAPEPALPH